MLLTNWLGNLTSRILKRPVYRSRERRSLRRRWNSIVTNRISTAEALEDRTLLTSLFQGELLPDAATNPGHLDLTGQAVAVDGDWMVVGAPEADTSQGVDSGAVYIYVRNDANTPDNETDDTWDFHSTLLTPSSSNPEYDKFGTAVDIDGDLIIVGSPFATDGDSPSSAYIFTRMDSGTFNDLTDDVWSYTTTLSRSEDMEPLGQEGFGNAVAIKGNTAVLGVHSDRSFGYPLGATYVFSTDDSWSSHSVNTLRASDGTGDDWFGNSVSVTEDGNTIIVGSYRDDSSTGAVYFYSRDRMGTSQVSDDSWSETQKVSANVAGSQFGWAVDIDGNTAIVGANYRPDPVNAGSAYILEADEFNNWGIVAELRAADAAQYEQYGYSVSISGNLAVVGNVFDDDLISNAGSVYIYNGAGGWTSAPVQKIYPSNPTLHTNFGRSVSISGDTIVVGANAHEHDFGGTTGIVKTGSAYAFGPSSPLSPTIFVDDNFSNPVVGQDPDGPGGAIEFGYDAFTRIQDAIDKVADGGNIYIAPGTYLGNANATSSRTDKDVTLGIGTSAAQVVMHGDLSLDFGDTLDFQIAGNTAGTSYDQVVVNGSVSINDSFLKLQDFYNPLEGDQFILIQNDGTDPIEGEFFLDGTLTRLTEGYEFTDFMGVAGQSAYLTYKGGDGNDLAIVVEDSTPQVSLPFNGTADQYTLKLVGEHVILSYDTTGDVLYNVPLSALGGPLIIDGEPGQDDTLTIDLTGIDDSTPLQVVFNGGIGGNDALNLTGGDLVTMNYYFDNASDGRIALNTPMNEFLTYTGLEPITSTVDSENVVLYYDDSSETISITDASGGMTTVNSTAGEMLTFIDPTDVLLINAGGGDDIINIDSLADNYSGELRIVGGDDDDTLNVNTSLSLSADKYLLLTAEDINLNGGSITTNGYVWQSYHGDVNLGADTVINNTGGEGIYFDFTVNGSHALDVTSDGFVVFYDDVTVNELTVNAGTVAGQLSGSINTGSGDVEMTAGENIAITNITTTGEVRLTAVTGAIADNSADESSNINADRAVLRAGTDIGGSTDDTLETSVNTLAASVANGNIEIVNTGALEIGTVDSLDGVTATNGNVIITAASPLTVNQTISGDSVTLTTIDSAAAGDNLTINADISSTVSDITLNSGDDFTLSALATLTSSTTININVDPSAGDPDTAGSTVDLLGDVSATGTTITGGDNTDTFNITPSANSPISVVGGNPAVSPGDTLTYLTPASETTTFTPIDSDGGTISVTGGSADVTFDEIENMTMSGASSLVVNGTFNSDVLTITATNSNSGTYQLNNGPVVQFSNITEFTFNAQQGLDRLDIINPTGGVFDPVNGLTYNANTGTIQIMGGQATTVEHRMSSSTNGSLFYDGESTATIKYNGVGSVFAVNDQVSVTDRILTYNTGDEDFIISDGEFVVSTTVDSDGGPSVSFSSPTGSLTINTTVGADTLTFYDLALDFDADLNINGGTVEFIRDLDLNSGDLNLDVDSVEIAAALSTTGNVNIQATSEIQMLASSFVGSIDAGAGDIILTGGWIQLRSLSTTGNVSLTANTTAIYDSNGGSVNITADQVALRSVTGSEGLEINANTLAASADSGNLSFVNSGDLIIGTVDGLSGLTASEGLVNVIANGALIVNDAVYAIDAVDLMTGDTYNSGEDLTINADVTSYSAIVTLSAADILTIATGSTVSGGEVQMLIDAGLPGSNDTAGGTANINGTLLGSTLELRGGNHDDTVIIDSNGGTNNDGGTLDVFDFPFTFYGFLGFDSFILDDSGDTTGDIIEIQDLAPGSGLIRGMASPGIDITYDSGVDQVTLATGSGADEITLTPNTVTAFNILGGDPTIAPGDTLTYVTPAGEIGLLTPDGPDGGTITIVDDIVGYKDVVFDEIETTLVTENLTIEGTLGDDEMIITATDANSGTYQLNGGAIIAFNNLTDLTFYGLDGDDRLVINNPTGGLFNPVDGVIFNGGTGGETNGDTLEVLGGTAGTVEHRFVNDNEGAIHYDGQLNATIVYTGLEPIIDTIEATSREFHYSDSSETITLTDAGGGQSTIDSTAGELVTFVNPTSFLKLFSGGGSDIINIDSLGIVQLAPIAFEIDAGAGNDTVNVGSNIAEGPFAITGSLTLKGGEGDDTFNLDSLAADLNLNLTINGQDGANDIVNVNSPVSLTSTTPITFNTETINLNGGSITSAGSQYYSGNVFLGDDTTIDAGDQLFLEGTVNGAFTLDVSAISLIALFEDITTSGLTASSGAFFNMESDVEINAGAGDISLTAVAPIGLASLTTTGDVDITSVNGSIYDINGDANNITANHAALRAQGNIYENSDYLNTQVNTLAAISNTGDILIENTGNMEIGSFDGLLGLSATQGTITVKNTGAISVTENISARDEVSLDSGDIAGANEDLSITNGATVQSTNSNIYLFAGDDFLLDATSSISASTTLGIHMDTYGAEDPEAEGGVLSLLGIVASSSDVNLYGGSGEDTFNVTPSMGTILRVDAGFPMVPAAPGDTFNYIPHPGQGSLISLSDEDSGVISATGGYSTVFFNNIESVSMSGDVRVNGSSLSDDELTLNATGSDSGVLEVVRGVANYPAVTLTNITDFTFNGNGGDDTFTIINPTGSLFAPVNGITFNGGTGDETNGDKLEILGGSATSVEHSFTNDSDGTVFYNGAATATITYTGLEPIIDTIIAADRVFTFTAGIETISVNDAGPAGQTLIDSTFGESVRFVNPTESLTINSNVGADTIEINGLDAAFDADLTVDVGVIEVNGAIDIGSGELLFDAGIVFIDDAITTTGNVTIETNSSLIMYATGSIDAGASSIDLTGSLVRIGEINTTGDVSVTATISGIFDSNGLANNITANNVVLRSASAIGSTGSMGADRIDLQVNAIAATADYHIAIINTGSLNIGTVDGLSGLKSNTGIVSVHSSEFLNVNETIEAEEAVFLTVDDSAAAANDLTINADITSHAANINLTAGDILNLTNGVTLNAATSMYFYIDTGTNPSGLVDPEGGIAYLTGTLIAPDGIQILGGSHDDLIIIDSNGGTANDGGTVDNIQNAFTILGSSGSDSLILDDSGDTTGDTIAITTATTPVPAGAGSITGVGLADFDYTTLENITLTTGTAADDISVTPSTDTSINVVGGDPAMSPGDTLTYLTPVGENASLSPDGADGGTISATGGYQSVTFDEIESLTLADNPVLNLVGTSGHDTLIITATNSNSGTYQLNGGPIVSFANITDFTFDGLASDDRLVINNPTGGVFDPVNGIIFNGGDGNETNGDSLEILGGMTERIEHEFVNDSDGSIYFDSETTATIVYTGLEPIIDTIDAEWRIFQYSDSAKTVTVTDAGSGLTSIDSTAGEMVTFAAPTEVLAIFTGDGDDTLNIDSLAADYGAELVIYGEGGANDTLNVNSPLSIGESHRIVFAVEAVNLNGGSITSGGSQSYSGDVTLGTNTIINAGSDLSFFRSITGAYTLDLQSDTAIVFRDTVSTGALTANADGSIVMLDSASINAGAGNISLIAGLAVALMDITTTGDVVITAMTGHIIDDNGAAVNITANSAALRAFEDIGFDGPDLETQVNLLAASSTTGDIRIINTGSLEIGSFDGLLGLTASNGDVSVQSSGAITVTEDVTANSIDFNAAIVNLDSDLDSVSISGNATNVNVLGSTGGAEIQDAVDLSAAGGTAQIAAGTYTPSSTITVSNVLTIQGAQAGVDPRPGTGSLRDETDDTTETIIDGSGSLSRIFLIDADDVTLDGLVITNGTGDLVRSSNPVDNITVQYNIIHNSTGDEGVQLANASNSTIQYNYIFDIEGDGANFDTASNGSIRFNEMRNIRSTNAAIFVDDSEAVTIEGNYLNLGHLNNNDGIKVNDFSGTYNTQTSYIINNTVIGSLQDGITVGRSNVVVSGNEVTGSSSNNGAIFVSETVDNVEITNNSIHDNLAAVSGTDTNYAIRIGKDPSDFPTNVIVRDNSIVNNDGLIFFAQNSQANLDALRNWWGTTDASVIAAGIVGVMDGGGNTNGPIDFSTILISVADTDGVTPGFQPDTSSLSVHDFGSEPAAGSRIQNALGLLDDSGTLFIQSGTYTENVDTTSTGTDMSVTLAPGNSPGQVTINGNLTLNADDVLELELNGTTAGTGFDQLIINGTLNLGSASLNLIDGYDPTEGDQFLLLANDGTDPVVGTFVGLTEGYEFTDFLGVIGQSAFLTYLGGDGNDVAIIVEDSTPQITLPVNSQSNNYRLELSGSHLILTDVDSGEVIYNVPMNALGGPLTINGEVNQDDTLIVDMTGIDENTPLQIIFNGGAGGNDTLAFEGGSLSSMEYYFTNASAGSVQFNGSGTNFLTYTGLEPITSTVNATNVTLNYGADSETITITDAGGGQTTVNSTSGEVLTFFNPTGTLTINAGDGDDLIIVNSLDAAFTADIFINGELDNDTVTLATGSVALGSGNITVNTEDINVNGAVTTTGNVDFNSDNTVTFTSAGSINAASGTIDIVASSDIQLGQISTTGDVTVTTTSGNIADNNSVLNNITADKATLIAGVGSIGLFTLETMVTTLEVSSGGSIDLDNTGDLTIGESGGLTGLNAVGNIRITSTGTLDVTEDVITTNGWILLATFDSATNQDLTIQSGATVQSTGSYIRLIVGDDLEVETGAALISAAHIEIQIDQGGADPGTGSTASLFGTLNAVNDITVAGGNDNNTVIIDGNGGLNNNGGTVDGINAASFVFNGAGGMNELILDDSGDLTADTIEVTYTGAGIGKVTGAGVTDFDFNSPNLDIILASGSADDNVSVELGASAPDVIISSAGGNDNLTILGRAGGNDFLSVTPIDSDEVLITDINSSNQISFDGLSGTLLIDGQGSSGSDHVIVHGTSGADNTTIDTIGGILTTTIDPSLISVGVQNIDYLDVRTGSGADQIQVSPHSDIAIDIYGDAPSILPGDVLNYTAPAGETSTLNPIDASSGSITTTGGFANIAYDGIETQNELTASPDLTVNGTAADDVLTINATGADSGTYQLNSGPVIAFSGVTGFTFNGLDGDDRLVINNPVGGGFDPVDGIIFNGGTGGEILGDSLEIVGGTATSVEHRFVNENDGSIFFDGEGTATITYTGLEPIIDNIDAVNRIFNFTGAAETITLSDDGDLGDGESMINSTLGESVIFTHPTASLTINTNATGGIDALNIEGLDSTFDADVTIIAKFDDTTTFQTNATDIGSGDLTIDRGSVIFDQNVTTTGNAVIDATGGSIIDGGSSADDALTADTLVLSSSSGIGTADDALDISVNNLEAITSGTIWINSTNVNPLTIGGIGPMVGVEALFGISLVVTGQLLIDEKFQTFGDVLIESADSITMAGATRVRSENGAVEMTASGDILLSRVVAGGTVDVQSTAGAILDSNGTDTNVIADGGARLRGNSGVGTGANLLETTLGTIVGESTTGGFFIENTGNLSIGGGTFAGGIQTDGEILVENTGDINVNTTVQTNGSEVSLFADNDLILNAAAVVDTTSSAGVTLLADSDLSSGGSFTQADGAGLVNAQGGTLYISATDNVLISDLQSAGGTVEIHSFAGDIRDNSVAEDALVSAGQLLLRAETGIGTSTGDEDIDTAVSTLAAIAFNGDIVINNTGALSIGNILPLNGLTASNGNVTVTASSPLTVNSDVTAAGTVTLTATDSAGAGDNLSLSLGVTVESTGADVILNSGDDFLLDLFASVIADTTITINVDPITDGAGAIVDLLGNVNATQTTINGGDDSDIFNILPTVDSPITVNG
ncbi:hypothetical protein, partial [Gimesia sp.]|uniref:hypothetical protein n=1 Tax=Gimesia sp. TaxID=2024833 RepID=UPI0032EFAAC8